MQSTLSLLVLRTSKLDAMLMLYRALGLAFTQEQHGNGPIHHSCDLGGTVLEIYPGTDGTAPERKAGGATSLGFQVSSIEKSLTALKQLGTPIITPPKDSQWGLRAVIADPDGRAVEISQSR